MFCNHLELERHLNYTFEYHILDIQFFVNQSHSIFHPTMNHINRMSLTICHECHIKHKNHQFCNIPLDYMGLDHKGHQFSLLLHKYNRLHFHSIQVLHWYQRNSLSLRNFDSLLHQTIHNSINFDKISILLQQWFYLDIQFFLQSIHYFLI